MSGGCGTLQIEQHQQNLSCIDDLERNIQHSLERKEQKDFHCSLQQFMRKFRF